MTLGAADNQIDLFDDVTRFCEQALPESSIYAFLRRERDPLFADEAFADLFDGVGRRSVPPSIVAVVMVVQRLEGLSDREAVERFCFDNAGVMPPVSAAMTPARRAWPTPWPSRSGSLCATRLAPTASSRARSVPPKTPASWARSGHSIRHPSMTRWRPWTPSP